MCHTKVFDVLPCLFSYVDVLDGVLNEENTWDNATTCENVEGPCELIRRDETLKALRMIKKGKAAGPTGIVSEMFIAEEDCSVEWLTSLQFDSSSRENS